LDKGEDVGYLPGLEEKFRIYNHPLMDSLEYIMHISELPDSDAGVVPDTFAMRFSRV
jgi:phosphate starvation-inducible protein PhoH